MEYEIVHLEEKLVAGLSARTQNDAPDMGQIIGGLWKRFFEEEYAALPCKVDGRTIGLYSNYTDGAAGAYDITVCAQVASAQNLPARLSLRTIPAGTYAKFVVTGHMQQAVAAFWQALWQMGLDRKFGYDFEEYQPGGDPNQAVIHIYISLNENGKENANGTF